MADSPLWTTAALSTAATFQPAANNADSHGGLMDTLPQLYEIARHNGGLITRTQAESVGIAHQRLTELARDGLIARIANGVYIVGTDAPQARDPRGFALAHRVALSHVSAAAWYGADLPAPPVALEVTAPRNRGQLKLGMPGVVLHRSDLGPNDCLTLRGVSVTTPLRTALDVARTRPLAYAVAVVDGLIRLKLISADQFGAAASRWQGPGKSKLRQVSHLIDPNSGSILESLCRILMWQHGIPTPISQFRFNNQRLGLVGRFDFGWPELRAILECDGYEYHAAREPFQKDRRRWSAVGTSGWHLAVVTWFDVTCDPDYVIAAVRDLLSNS